MFKTQFVVFGEGEEEIVIFVEGFQVQDIREKNPLPSYLNSDKTH